MALPLTVPSKTAGSLGVALTNVRTPRNNEHDANGLEVLKQTAIDLVTELNALGVTVSGLGNDVLYEMPIATDSVAATPSLGRGEFDTPITPAGVTLIDLLADPANPGRNALRVGATGLQGAAMFAVNTGALPAEGYILEVDVAQLPVESTEGYGLIGLMYEDYSLGGSSPTPRGIFASVYRGASNIDGFAWRLGSTLFTESDPIAGAFAATGAARFAAQMQNGGLQLRFVVRRVNAQTPAQFSISCTAWQAGASSPAHYSFSNVTATLNADLDGKTFTKVGLGGYRDGSARDSWIAVRSLKIRKL